MSTTEQIAEFAAKREAEAERTRDGFMKRHGFRKYKNDFRNILKALMRTGRPKGDCEAVAARLCRSHVEFCRRYAEIGGLLSGPFDHGEILGKTAEGPMYLMGYPYQIIGEDHWSDLDALRSLGMKVLIHAHSNYGHGTIQIEAFADR